jgi:hypothetical protein
MIINYPGKYSDLKRFFLKNQIKIMHNFDQEINNEKLSECPDVFYRLYENPTMQRNLCDG